MKYKSVIIALLLFAAGAGTAWSQALTLHLAGKPPVLVSLHELDKIVCSETHEWVDLGLPSGTLWATCNVGAKNPEDFGVYFAWGETKPKEDFSWATYIYCLGTANSLTKYCHDRSIGHDGFADMLSELLPEDDAATVNWGEDWQMPSQAQLEELYNRDNTTQIFTTQNDVDGWLITSKSNGGKLFLPAAYNQYMAPDGNIRINLGGYWSRSLNTSDSHTAYVQRISYTRPWDFNDTQGTNDYRYQGHSVRPVRVQGTSDDWLVTSISLSATELLLRPGETQTLSATVLPSNARIQKVTWESSDESVARVNQNGAVTTVNEGNCIITCRATDSSGVYAECQLTVENNQDPVQGHEYVDLGLPSGTLWATCNIGADIPQDNGDYFAWGEIEPKDEYSWSTYKWMNEGEADENQINKYTFADGQQGACWYYMDWLETFGVWDAVFIGDGIKNLSPEDDVATVCWGDEWQMPSPEQFEELLNSEYTTTTWTSLNLVKVLMITSKSNDRSIFLPAAGKKDGTSLVAEESGGYYWSRSFGQSNYSYWAAYLSFSSSKVNVSGDNRCYGMSVRPVLKK